MNGLSYQRLEKIMNEVPHFRGNVNRFPLGQRRQNNKYFLVRDEDGQKVFDIVYGNTWQRHDITKEEFDLRGGGEVRGYASYDKYDKQGNKTGETDYVWYETIPNVLGVVRPDGTFQFTKDSYHQGDRGFLSQFSTGWFTTQSRHGGMLYRQGRDAKFLPIWKDMKVNIGDMTPTTPYKVVIHHVDRKKAKAMLKGYEHFFKVSEVMVKSMTMEILVKTAQEIINEAFGEDGHKTWHSNRNYLTLAHERVNDAPLDAFVFFALGHDFGRFTYMVRWNNLSYYGGQETPESLFASLKRKLSRELYRDHPDVFKIVEREGDGKPYPACDWGTKIIVDGKEMVQL